MAGSGLRRCRAGKLCNGPVRPREAQGGAVRLDHRWLLLQLPRPRPDGATAHTEFGLIHGIAVRPESRRQGVATALLTACEEYLDREGARVMIAEVRPDAVAFFSAHGYAAAAGPALHVPTSAGTYIHPQCTYSTTLMWKSSPGAAVTPERSEQGTLLAGVEG
ncbi:GNAT family N-acetyltransferase [Streptomyces sp. NPDC093108]|uniref:GNAT family N-acetyltransferase n=1 Tax=Streptomyces sp. NPDC093108 TaxID=3366030 RepID=UPI0038266FBF